ncbi:MAG: hypothetical protein QNJ34_28595 [Xenococcaceae cyanobacterium MO_188.B29]|nr:hypothetical protein [Xenococcaceae cyanobacterium MO_188.B29]
MHNSLAVEHNFILVVLMKDFELFPQLASYLLKNQYSQASVNKVLQDYAQVSLETLERIPQLVSFLVEEEEEKEKYPLEHHIVLRKELTQAKKYIAQHIATAISNEAGLFHASSNAPRN